MLPRYISDQITDDRFTNYKRNLDLFKGDHYKHFNYDEQDKKVNKYEYICYSLIKTAIETKTNLIWHDKPIITFENAQTQEVFDTLRTNTNFDYVLQQATTYAYLFGDCLTKVMIDDNLETSNVDDKELYLYLQTPQNWFPDHDQNSPNRSSSQDTLLFKRIIENDGTAYLLESHQPGKISWTAYFSNNQDKDDANQVPLLRYFADIMDGIVADGSVGVNDLEASYLTECTYSLLHRLKSQTVIDSYFGMSDVSMPVISKLNALNNYSNLADVIIVTNSFPKLILSENAGNIYKRIADELNGNNGMQSAESSSGLTDTDLTQMPGKSFLSRQSYAQSYMYRNLANEMKAFVDGSQGGQTKYLTNDFSLEEIRKQHDIFFNSIMSELGISEVFYNAGLVTGASSGVAYKRLMTTTLNSIEVTKRNLEVYLKKVIFTMLELANSQNLVSVEAQMPNIIFQDGIITDETEDLNNLILKVQNDLLPLKEAIMQANNVAEGQAENWLLRMVTPDQIVDETIIE